MYSVIGQGRATGLVAEPSDGSARLSSSAGEPGLNRDHTRICCTKQEYHDIVSPPRIIGSVTGSGRDWDGIRMGSGWDRDGIKWPLHALVVHKPPRYLC